ncbi:MAG: hypothetical protein HZA31_01505 [Opitutae bacterium]|nr:hypothetical protein [Opitutae bacterium]
MKFRPVHHTSRPAARRLQPLLALAVLVLAGTGCTTIKRTAVNQLGDALASGSSGFATDDDPELIKAATPFSLKLLESLLAESPRHPGLLLAAASGFTQYTYAFVQQEADETESKDLAAAQAMRLRARRLYLRAKDYALRGLDAQHPGFRAQLAAGPAAAVQKLARADVPLAYWAAAAWGSAISLGKDDPALVAELPQMEALIDRALALDESWGDGAIHGFLINYEMSRQGMNDDPTLRARRHFERAVALAAGKQAAPFVTFAEAVCLEKQDAAQFEQLLQRALALDPDAAPEFRLANLVVQRRARWLLARKDELFLTPAKPVAP